MTALDRRTFLLGAAGLASAGGILAACGDDGGTSDGEAAGSSTTSLQAPLAVPALVPTFPDGFRAPSPFVHSVEQRVAYALHDGNDIMRDNAPDTITLELFAEDTSIGGGEIARRDVGVPTPYYPVYFTPSAAGTHTAVFTAAGEEQRHEFLVLDPGETEIPQPGDVLPSVATATVDDARGVDPICTRTDPCPFHARNLADVLGTGDKPIVLSIATPGFCQTAICGPVIEMLITTAESRDDLHVIHAEVYADPFNDPGLAAGSGSETTDIVNAYTLHYEPVLYVADATGTVVRRLDAVYDESELAEALALV